MIINILNYQNGITDEEVVVSMEEFINYLEENDVPCNNIQLIYNDQSVKKTID